MAISLASFVNEGNVFFRAPLLLALVWFLWGVNVFVFDKVNIDYCAALGFDRTTSLWPRQICTSAIVIFGAFFGCWFLYTIEWPFADPLVTPGTMYIVSLFCLVLPLNVFHRKGRKKLLHNLLRVFQPSMVTGVLFVEVVMGDVLTSLSKALADFQVSFCVLAGHFLFGSDHEEGAAAGMTPLSMLEASCAESWMRPIITSLPFLLRFRQCIVAYMVTGKAFPHLVNAAKYASAFPVIWISTFAHNFPASYGLFLRKAWLISITFNSFFSFIWDVVMDFGLFRSDTEYVFLRRHLYYMSSPSGTYSRVPLSDSSAGNFSPSGTSRRKHLKSKDSLGDLDAFEDEGPARDRDAGAQVAGDLETGQSMPVVLRASVKKAADPALRESVAEAASVLVKRMGSGDGSDPEEEEGALSPTTPSKPVSFDGRPVARYQPLLPSTPIIYYAAIILDFLLRVLWSFKLSVHLHLTSEGLTFVLEICEVFRRFLWLFFRIEWQVIEMRADALLHDDEVELAERHGSENSNNASASIRRRS